MTTTTQQISSDPARDFANAIFAETNNGQDLIDLLHDIAQGAYGATYNDRISANTILTDRGLGKCPKQSPAANPHRGEHAPSSDEEGQSEPKATDEPESPRLVTQIDDSLHQSLGPAPSAHSPTVIPMTSRIPNPLTLSTPLLSRPLSRTTFSKSPTTVRPSAPLSKT